jgi:pyruvate/2-oxoglutarate/acetoin dehydrogenase E1 component
MIKKIRYKEELIRSMDFLAKNKKTIFIGQSVQFSGNAIFNTLNNINNKKKLELPVFEDVQMGLSIGLALDGYVPISCYPRFDFLILAMNQLVNHLDKIRRMSNNEFKPRIIIRTSIGSKKPLDGGLQHTQDFTALFKNVLKEINVVLLKDSSQIYNEFKKSLLRKDGKSTLMIEYGEFYNSK